jgi:hypothetical protein
MHQMIQECPDSNESVPQQNALEPFRPAEAHCRAMLCASPAMVESSREQHSLIGVANICLEALFHDLRMDYHVLVINQQGEVCGKRLFQYNFDILIKNSGKLHVEISRLPSSSPPSATTTDEETVSTDGKGNAENFGGNNVPPSLTSSFSSDFDDGNPSTSFSTGADDGFGNAYQKFLGRIIRCRICVRRATNLPQALCNFVFCQYSFHTAGDVVAASVAPEEEDRKEGRRRNSSKSSLKNGDVVFDSEKVPSSIIAQ